MRTPIIATVVLALAAPPALAAVDVSFTRPERFTDAALDRSFGDEARQRTLEGIERHFRAMAERWLPPGRDLRVEIIDIDLAGRYEPLRAPSQDVRAMLDVTWPRITLRYALEENGRPVATAQEEVTDLDYLVRPQAQRSRDPLRYEKAMLDDWFRSRFAGSTGG